MKKIYRVVNKIENYDFVVPLDGSLNLHVKKGDSVTPRKVVMTKEYKKVLASYYLPKELKSELKDSKDYIVRLNGEYVTKGEVLAERLIQGGLTVKKIVATSEGILSFARINEGFIEILGENSVEEVYTQFYGKVVDIDVHKGIVVQSKALSLQGLSNLKTLESIGSDHGYVSGEFCFVKDGDSIYTVKDLEDSYEGKIVYAGKFVYADVVNQLYMRGAKHVIAYSMNYLDYADLKLAVTILGGFGNLGMSDLYPKVLMNFKNLVCVMDFSGEISKVVFPDNGQYLPTVALTTKYLASLHEGMSVIVKDMEMFNNKGRILEINTEENLALVVADNGKRALLNETSLVPFVF